MDPRKLSTGANLLRLSTLGMNFAFCVFLGLGLGWGAQKLFRLGDWSLLVGMVFGIVSSYVLLFEEVKKINKPPSP